MSGIVGCRNREGAFGYDGEGGVSERGGVAARTILKVSGVTEPSPEFRTSDKGIAEGVDVCEGIVEGDDVCELEDKLGIMFKLGCEEFKDTGARD